MSVSLSECGKKGKWLAGLFEELSGHYVRPMTLQEENKGVKKWSSSDKRAKYIDLRDHIVNCLVEMAKCSFNSVRLKIC